MRKLNTDALLDPDMIMTVIVSLIILAVGVFAFFVTIESILTSNNTQVKQAINNTSDVGNSVFSIVGVVLVIGAIMAIIGVVYSFVGGDYKPKPKKPKHKPRVKEKPTTLFNDVKPREKPTKKKEGWQI